MIKWEKCELEAGVTAEFPLDFLAPSVSNKNKNYYWDQKIKEVVEVDNNSDYMVVPTFDSIDDEARSKMELLLDDSYKKQFVEIISGNKVGLMVLGSYKNYPWTSQL